MNRNSIFYCDNQMDMLQQKVYDFFVANPILEELRVGQQDLALDIADAIASGQNLIAEAGVGIGKSFSYIYPLMVYNAITGYPVAIATSTIALQDQLVNDIESIKSLSGYNPEVINITGKTHYICRAILTDELMFSSDRKSEKILENLENGISDKDLKKLLKKLKQTILIVVKAV